jgi:hypothetical protein
MKLRRWLVAGGVVIASVAALATPAHAENGNGLRVGDVVCTGQGRTPTGVFFSASITNGAGVFTVHEAATVGGPERVIFSQSGESVSALVSSTPGNVLRGCVRITSSTGSTSFFETFLLLGPDAEPGLGPHTAVLSPGARACGDNVIGPAHLTGTASAPVTWSLLGRDTEFNPIGQIFSSTGRTIDEAFTPGPGVGSQEFCVTNTSGRRVTVSYEMNPA